MRQGVERHIIRGVSLDDIAHRAQNLLAKHSAGGFMVVSHSLTLLADTDLTAVLLVVYRAKTPDERTRDAV
jgi:hypothetical protein